MLDSFGRPALTSRLQRQASEINQRGLCLLRDREHRDLPWSRSLLAAATAGTACWQAMQPLMSAQQWRAVESSLRRQHQLVRPLRVPEAGVLATSHGLLRGLAAHAGTPAEARCLARLMDRLDDEVPAGLSRRRRGRLEELFHAQSRWLAATAPAAAGSEAALRIAIVGIYRRARKALCHDAAGGAARRRLASLAWIEELLAEPFGPMSRNPFPDSAAGRLWMGLEEDRRLRSLAAGEADSGLGRKDVERLARLIQRRRGALAQDNEVLVSRVVDDTPRAFAARLPWNVFSRLAQMPGRLEGG